MAVRGSLSASGGLQRPTTSLGRSCSLRRGRGRWGITRSERRGAWGRAHHGRGSVGSVARNAARSSDSSATGADERLREEGGCSRCASKRERRGHGGGGGEGRGAAVTGSALLNGAAGVVEGGRWEAAIRRGGAGDKRGGQAQRSDGAGRPVSAWS
jgi:hypothetical protein